MNVHLFPDTVGMVEAGSQKEGLSTQLKVASVSTSSDTGGEDMDQDEEHEVHLATQTYRSRVPDPRVPCPLKCAMSNPETPGHWECLMNACYLCCLTP